MKDFASYHSAYDYAQNEASTRNRDMGIEKTKWYGKTVFVVTALPKPENRYGHELRMEVVTPSCPKVAR
jgi:hypothetical protein